MPISKIKGTGIVDNVELQGTEAARMPVGTTAQREGSPKKGDIRFNDTTNLMEYYTGNEWKAIDSSPTVTSISPLVLDKDSSTDDIVITGTNFQSGATVTAIATNGTTVSASTVVVNSTSQITATFTTSSFQNALEPYDIKVLNTSGLSGLLENVLNVNSSPTWVTAANLGEVGGGETFSISLSASDPESDSLTYSSSDAPSGSSVASNGTFSGTADEVTSDTTKTFTASVTDGNKTANRTFNILYGRPALQINGSGQFINTGYTISTQGYYEIIPDQTMTVFMDMWGASGGSAGGVSNPTYGCAGGESYGEVTLTAGTTYVLLVGQKGLGGAYAINTNPLRAASFPDGGQNTGGQGYGQGNGGGSTRFGAYAQSGFNLTNTASDYNNTNAVYYMIAGAGAGGSDYCYGYGGTAGGFGGGTTGGAGGAYYNNGENANSPGGGGTQSAGGAKGYQGRLGDGEDGAKYQGGNATGSAGGGGYYGGGGANGYYALGGGGSGFINTNFVTNGNMATASAGTTTHRVSPDTNGYKPTNAGDGNAPFNTQAQGNDGNDGAFYIIANAYRS